VIPLLGIDSEDMKSGCQRDICTPMYSAGMPFRSNKEESSMTSDNVDDSGEH
jgi:hypothetical protein